jgi:formylmethanofuran dehydrogenase subunit A
VDCISTDGGGIPRNVTVEMGLALVRLGALSLDEFVIKTSWNPARMLNLQNKGHLSVGADADVTVLDIGCHEPVLTMASGQIIMWQGHVVGRGAQIITTQGGAENVKKNNLEAYVLASDWRPFAPRWPEESRGEENETK